MRLPVNLRVVTGSATDKTPSAIGMKQMEPTAQSVRARLGAKLKHAIEWVQQHLLFFIRW